MPEDRRLSITSQAHVSPDDVARHTFATVRRGFDPTEVRDFLESVAEAMRALRELEDDLRRQVSEAEERAAHPVLDEETLTSALGTETARVLRTAHEAAHDMIANAEAEAERLRSSTRDAVAELEARTEATLSARTAEAEAALAALRHRAEADAADALAAARSEAEELLEQTRTECRQMVEEAQALRARVLADLARRRKAFHAQIEQLRAGRERLAETVRDVRHSIDSIAEEIFRAEDEARLAAEAAGREAAARADELEPPDEHEPREPSGHGGASGTQPGLAEVAEVAEVAEAEPREEEPTGIAAPPPALPSEPLPTASTEQRDDAPTGELTAGARTTGSFAASSEETEATDGEEATGASPPEPPRGRDRPARAASVPSAEAVFAKIRAAREAVDAASPSEAGLDEVPAGGAIADETAPDGSDADGSDADARLEGDADGPPDPTPPLVLRRDELLAPVVTALSRRLKRLLQDEQNDLLDRLRSAGSQWSPDLLPNAGESGGKVAAASLDHLRTAAEHGASLVEGAGRPDVVDGHLDQVAEDLERAIIGPLRRRLEGEPVFEPGDERGAAEHVGAAFRVWKGGRVEDLATDHLLTAFALGTRAALATRSGAQALWLAVPGTDGPPCPDCEDNALAGSTPVGEAFPTGHQVPPAHPGCRCLLAPVDA